MTTTLPARATLIAASLAASSAQTIVVAALPGFHRETGAPLSAVAWLLTTFMLASAVATPIAGRLGDLYGHRRVLIASLGFLIAGTVLAALAAHAGSLPWLLAGRALQGVSGGVLPLTFGLARHLVPPDRQRGTIALLSAMIGLGGAAGMVIAGPLADLLGTPSLLWAGLLLAVPAAVGAIRLPETPSAAVSGVDLPGAALLCGTLVGLLLVISQGAAWGWTSSAVLGLVAATVALAAGFVWVQLRTPVPLVDLRLLRTRAMAVTNLTALVVGAAMFSAVTLFPQFVQTPVAMGGPGGSATTTGLVILPVALGMLAGGPLAGRLAARFGAAVPLRAGSACAAVTFAVLALRPPPLWEFYPAGLLLGIGYGLAFASMGLLVVAAAAADQTGVATGVNTIARTVGGAAGAQVASAILAATATAHVPTLRGYTIAFWTFAAIALLAVVTAALIPAPAVRESEVAGR
ncbi:MFS transporter [Nonomuraea sp. NPDC049141]|uniref:MFS transporter n=1 Tax=Nonomuraea sp. NPDC049141 TaxID=3155500 RepID=UPI0033C633E6